LVAASVGLTLCCAWAVLALAIDLPWHHWNFVVAAAFGVTVLAGLFLRRRLLVLLGFVCVLAWWLSLKPSNIGNWQGDVSQTAHVEVSGNTVTIHNFRSCVYRSELDYTCSWLTRTVDLNQIDGVDLFMDYWGSPWIAHTILSFDLNHTDHVAFSIETRKHWNQTFSALLGFFRQFTLISVVSDERDLVRLRTNYRKGEDLYLFHTAATPAFARSLFLNYIGMADELYQHPAWYNAITHNCTTEIYTLKSMKGQHLDWRILLNGKADEMAYQQGMLVTDGLPFPVLKQRAWINPDAKAANDDPEFSTRIRAHRPGF
jgi:hypothetical protein